jgi:hypothetical protein
MEKVHGDATAAPPKEPDYILQDLAWYLHAIIVWWFCWPCVYIRDQKSNISMNISRWTKENCFSFLLLHFLVFVICSIWASLWHIHWRSEPSGWDVYATMSIIICSCSLNNVISRPYEWNLAIKTLYSFVNTWAYMLQQYLAQWFGSVVFLKANFCYFVNYI